VLVSNENPAPYGITLDLEAIAQFGENLCLEGLKDEPLHVEALDRYVAARTSNNADKPRLSTTPFTCVHSVHRSTFHCS
jgi:hypothetical protein